MGIFSSDTYEAPAPVIKETPWGPQMRAMIESVMKNQFGGMTDTEQQAQGVLQQLLSGGTFQDPRTSPMYQGFRDESMREEGNAANQLRRRQQMSGMYNSSPAMRGEADLRSQFSNNRMGMLGSMYESERQRDNPYTRLQAVGQYGGLGRQIAGQQAGLAGSLLNYQPWYQPQMMSDPSMFSQVADPVGGLLSGFGSIFGK